MMLGNAFSDVVQGLISRTSGPLKFRFVLQPLMSIFFAIRSGLKDSREGKPAFFWEFCEDPAKRRELISDCWKSVGKVYILAFVLDCVYQVIVLRWIYFFDALIVAFFLAIIPYVIIRGPVNRIASARKHTHALEASESEPRPPRVKKAV
jgi:hypothetical protein